MSEYKKWKTMTKDWLCFFGSSALGQSIPDEEFQDYYYHGYTPNRAALKIIRRSKDIGTRNPSPNR